MNYKLSSIALSLLFLTACQSSSVTQAPEPEATTHLSQAVYEVEFDSALKFKTAMMNLQSQTAHFCQEESDLTQVSAAWQQGMSHWMWLQGQERGPAMALEQNWNVQFWPDKKNTTGRKMSQAVKTDVWTMESVQLQSVTIQGLGAIEWLLYDDASTLAKGSREHCSLATAITASLTDRADTIFMAWQTNPWSSLDKEGWESEYLALLSNQLDYSMKKLSRPLAKIGAPRPYFSESWRSETSMSNLKTNVEAMQALYLAKGEGLDKILRDEGHAPLADSIIHQFEDTLETWPSETSLFALLQSKQGYRTVLSQFNKLEQLKYLINEEAAIQLGVVIGFNATDGD
ncbi:imelysin family protein [Vibrio mediterranei]|uniref:imelysin family protein n=1 Tax=Vibrio mediterranei TaxID=689 RepID=UPI000D17E9E5|nr:imelysin family protein [Vibrio mediterranei]MCG9656658.1 iron-regulated protein A [Vibrio mediterranei]MCG9662010.1 iron-regulated protein A [Vibrio mediterranei]PTC03799.1 iron-regulated protein A [Vibrio mediterranei]